MKKVMMTSLVIGLFVAAVAVPPAWSQEKTINFSLNAGVQTNVFHGTSFDKALFTLDGRVGFALGRSWEVSPEAMVVFSYLRVVGGSGGTLVYPGVLLNYRAGNFFVGAGAVLPWSFVSGDSDTGNLAPKINVGYTFGQLQVTAYMIAWTESFRELNWVGLTLGYRF